METFCTHSFLFLCFLPMNLKNLKENNARIIQWKRNNFKSNLKKFHLFQFDVRESVASPSIYHEHCNVLPSLNIFENYSAELTVVEIVTLRFESKWMTLRKQACTPYCCCVVRYRDVWRPHYMHTHRQLVLSVCMPLYTYIVHIARIQTHKSTRECLTQKMTEIAKRFACNGRRQHNATQ